MQELSDLCRATSPVTVNISRDFSPREFAAPLHHLKLGKAPGPDSICQQHLIHAGPDVKFGYVASFLASCANSKFQKSGEGRW